jgi:hypothetical protein
VSHSKILLHKIWSSLILLVITSKYWTEFLLSFL